MTQTDPYATISQLGDLLRRKRITSLELTRMYLDRLERLGGGLGAVVTITRELAERQARAADREIATGRWRGPLHRIPYGAKDLLATAGIPTTWGAEPYRNQVFDYDATVVSKLRDAGAVLVAKLAMVELAGGFGYNEANASFTGPGRTPWNTNFWSGGSSSGPGAAVGAALVPVAIGSETSGSILTPSAFSGVTGFRPTYGVVSRHGAMALCWTLDKLGPMARSAADCALMMQSMAGQDPKDPTTMTEKMSWSSGALASKRRIAIIKGSTDKVQKEVKENFLASVEVLKRSGHEFLELDYPDMPFGPVLGTLVSAEGGSAFEDLLSSGKAKQLRARADRVEGFENGGTLAMDYLRAMRLRGKMRKALLELFDKADLIAGPTRASVSYPIEKTFQDAYPGISAGPSLIGAMNLLGAPAISLPNGFGENGLPTAIQIIGPPLSDPDVIGVGIQYQQQTDFHLRKPPAFA